MSKTVSINIDRNDRDKRYDYMVGGQVIANKMKAVGIKLSSARHELGDHPDDDAPVLVFCTGPMTGCVMAIMQDDEGNGPGAIHTLTKP